VCECDNQSQHDHSFRFSKEANQIGLVQILEASWLSECQWLFSISFESGSELIRIEPNGFLNSVLESVTIHQYIRPIGF
jgi:hypothetical protein